MFYQLINWCINTLVLISAPVAAPPEPPPWLTPALWASFALTEHTHTHTCSVMVGRYYNNVSAALCGVSTVSPHFVISGSHAAKSTQAFLFFSFPKRMNITSNPADCAERQRWSDNKNKQQRRRALCVRLRFKHYVNINVLLTFVGLIGYISSE